MIEEEVIGSQSEESEESETSYNDALKAFGVEPEVKAEEIEDKPAPAIEKAEPKKLTVKHNKEEVEVDISTDEKLTDHLQRSLALDKERERKSELEKNLDRAAKLAGYDNHAAYVADLDRLEQQQQQKQQTELETLRQDLLDQLEVNGVDRTKAEQWINNHPLIKQGEAALLERQEASKQAEEANKWQPLYQAYPELAEAVQKANGKPVEWFTPELAALVARGNDPLLAYEHLNKGKITAQTKKATEQRIIKEQHLGLRSKVETNSAPDNEPQVPKALADAFAAFGLPSESARKYIKK